FERRATPLAAMQRRPNALVTLRRALTHSYQRPRLEFGGVDRMPASGQRGRRPSEQKRCILGTQINAPMTAFGTKRVMPEGAMQSVAAFKEHNPRHCFHGVKLTRGLVLQIGHIGGS